MVVQVGITVSGNKKEFQGLSTDTKPSNCGGGSKFLELDTMEEFIFDCANVSPETNSNWWRA